jgi:hypothetical protein
MFLDNAAHGATTTERGRALEDLICYLFEKIPGVTVAARNRVNVAGSEEIDIAFWNEGDLDGFYFLPNIVLCESKDWLVPVGSLHVNWFDTKLRNRSQTHGILVALKGITGDSTDITSAHSVIGAALREGRHLVVLTGAELEAISTSAQLVQLMKRKLCDLAVAGTTLT